jgi:hypothetical protein
MEGDTFRFRPLFSLPRGGRLGSEYEPHGTVGLTGRTGNTAVRTGATIAGATIAPFRRPPGVASFTRSFIKMQRVTKAPWNSCPGESP